MMIVSTVTSEKGAEKEMFEIWGGVCKEHTKQSSLRTYLSILSCGRRTDGEGEVERAALGFASFMSVGCIYLYSNSDVVNIYVQYTQSNARPPRKEPVVGLQCSALARKTAAIDRPKDTWHANKQLLLLLPPPF